MTRPSRPADRFPRPERRTLELKKRILARLMRVDDAALLERVERLLGAHDAAASVGAPHDRASRSN